MANHGNFGDQTGYLGKDPVVRDAGGKKVVEFDVCTTKRWTDSQSKEKRESAFWRRYEAWGVHADNIPKLLKQGSFVRIISEPSNNDYEKEGQKIYSERHTVTQWFVLDRKANEDGAASGAEG
jgi:single-stranded DNA-binding protein